MTGHPYRSLPDHCFWQRGIADVAPSDVDPVIAAKFRISRADRVATAGSCFAQHMARHLSASGFNHFVTESAHPMIAPELRQRFGYGVYSARYGNLYTSRQLIQLLRRAYGMFAPVDEVWRRPDGRCIDPYRPRIQPNGFASLVEYQADRRQHFSAIRRLVEQLEVFVFTLGLTETWVNREDGAAYPLCPGVAGGEFDPSRHSFENLRVAEIVADLEAAIELIRTKNPRARFILTVSPVPLIATMEPRSVLVSTTYSKSALRVAAEEVAAGRDYVAYFPSYEVITGAYNRGAYFADDLRSVTEAGVAHVMRLFMRHYADHAPIDTVAAPAADLHLARRLRKAEEVIKVICDEEALQVAREEAEDAALVERAHAAGVAGDWQQAARYWAEVRARLPAEPDGVALGGMALRMAGRLDEAETVAREAVNRYPGDARPLLLLVEIAAQQSEWEAAVSLCAALRSRFRYLPDGYALGAKTLRSTGRFDEADALTTAALTQFPDDINVATEHAWVAVARRDWDAAIHRSAQLRTCFPDLPQGYTLGAVASREAEHWDEADAIAAAGLQRFPDNTDIRIQQAWIALSRRDWDRALKHCADLRRDVPDRAEGYAIAAVALRVVGRLDASEQLAALALPRFPDDARLAVVHAYAAGRQGDWPTAVQRWEQVRQRFPGRLDGFTNGIAVLRRSGRMNDAAALAEDMARRFPA